MRHIALMIPGLDRLGGAERQVMLLSKGLRRRGWQVSVVALSGSGGASAAELADAGVRFLSLGMRHGLADPRGWIRFWRWVWRERPEIVHAHLAHAAFPARWSRLVAPIPVLIDTLHSSWPGKASRRLGYRVSKWLPDLVTAVSHSVAEAHHQAGLVRQRRLVVVPNGIDTETFRPDRETHVAMRRALGISDEFLWIAVGRLEAVKDYPTLLRAMTEVPERGRLVIAGAGPLKDELVRLATRIGVGDRVRFPGFDREIKRWMQAADGFVLCSRWEGLPMALLEAGACGVPTVATDVPGTRDMIVDGENGWLVPAGEPAALAKAMTAMMEAPAEARCSMGECARRRVVEHFSLERVLDEWERLYRELSPDPGSVADGEGDELASD